MSTSLQMSSVSEKTVEDYALYSSTIHNVIFTVIGVLIGLLQITPTDAGVRSERVRGFLVLSLIYFFLLVCEAKLRRNEAIIHNFVGHCSHLFGAFAANMLVSLIFPIFALVVAVLCLFWFFFVMYRSFAKKMLKDNLSATANSSDQLSKDTLSGTANLSDQLSPV